MTEEQQLQATILASMNEPNGKDEDEDEEEEEDDFTTQGTIFQLAQRYNVPSIGKKTHVHTPQNSDKIQVYIYLIHSLYMSSFLDSYWISR
jgi:hypothetical protein